MAFGLRTLADIVIITGLVIVLAAIAAFEYAIFDATIGEYFRDENSFYNLNYNKDGTPKYPDEYVKGFRILPSTNPGNRSTYLALPHLRSLDENSMTEEREFLQYCSRFEKRYKTKELYQSKKTDF